MFHFFNRWEKLAILILSFCLVASGFLIFRRYVRAVASPLPAQGGGYSEGMVGKSQYLNPVLADFNPVDKNLSSLIFSGLMKYNSETGELEDDLADHTLSENKKVFTFKLRPNVKWHDGVPVKSEDILFTYVDVLQHEKSPNLLMKEGLKDVKIEAQDDQTVTFTLTKPYKFFLTNFTIGLLPKHVLADVPVENLSLSDFNTENPIGTGPFKWQGRINTNSGEKITLVRNDDYQPHPAYLSEINIYLFSSWTQLILQQNLLDGMSLISAADLDNLTGLKRFIPQNFTLKRYAAAFLNTQSPILKNQKVRLALKLATNKDELLKDLREIQKIDTPFLELNESNWANQWDLQKAMGSLNDGGWLLPWKWEEKKQNAEKKTKIEEDPNFIFAPNQGYNYATNEKDILLEGKVPAGTQGVWVNDYQLKLFKPEKGTFSFKINPELQTLKEGLNTYHVYAVYANKQKKWFDSIEIFYSTDAAKLEEKQKTWEAQKQEKIKLKAESAQKIKEEEEKAKKAQTEISPERLKETRTNEGGEKLKLTILSPNLPVDYVKIGEKLVAQWKEIGVEAELKALETEA
ncbi:MAG TPA: ABC transporter substrate-binding protein, partial [Candidatus Gracilibacteria bacterium]|nr:ABC transporter substrate-binding protein [Candidatus Gracilibacteria bacterium]